MIKKNLNRKKLTHKIYQNIGFSKIISENIVNDIFNIIISSLAKNDKTKIKSFGTFFKKKKIKELDEIQKLVKKKLFPQEM